MNDAAVLYKLVDGVATLWWDPTTGQEKPALRRGGWILDATMPLTATSTLKPGGYFYRVVNVDELAVAVTDLKSCECRYCPSKRPSYSGCFASQ